MSKSIFSWPSLEGKKQTGRNVPSLSNKSSLDFKREDSFATVDTTVDDGEDGDEGDVDWWICPEGVNRTPFTPRPKPPPLTTAQITRKRASSMFSPSRAAKALLSSVGIWDKPKGGDRRGTTDHHPFSPSRTPWYAQHTTLIATYRIAPTNITLIYLT